tara:strand:+ start:3634 stop:4752 length:1119 start_codon:yes stop_codon:yes gene_type:complete
MILERKNCIYCKTALEKILELEKFPIKFACVKEKEEWENTTLSFSYCNNCKTIQLDKLIDLKTLYSVSHNTNIVGNLWQNLYTFIKNIITEDVEKSNVLEIGCPSGKILKTQDKYNLWYIIDPNVMSINKENVLTINDFFNENTKLENKIDLIVHSHLFEHIYDPIKFIQNCYNILENNGKMVFAIPNMEYHLINNISPFGSLHFEHTIFHTKKKIVKYLQENGFQILNIYDYEKHSIIFETKKTTNNINKYIIKDNTNYLKKFYLNVEFNKKFIEKCTSFLKKEKKNIYIFGASIYSNVLLYFGLDKLNISGILDNSVAKHNKYLYGYNIKIYSPEILIDNNSIVILRNGIYSEEIKKQIIQLNKNTIIID